MGYRLHASIPNVEYVAMQTIKVKYKGTILGGRECYREVHRGRYFVFEDDIWYRASKDYEKSFKTLMKIEVVK